MRSAARLLALVAPAMLDDLKYYDLITKTGGPAETRGVRNPYGGMTFPLEAR